MPMRFLSVLLCAAACASAADFQSGQAARALIGQPFFTRQQSGASDTLIGGVSGLAYANGTLFVADSNRAGSGPINNRVLLFNNLSSVLPSPTDELFYTQRCPVCVGQASVVLGQPDFTTTDYSLSQTGMRLPTSIATDGIHLIVADTDNNRVLIWNRIPQTNGAPADVVVGQPDFNSSKVSIPPNSKSMRGPQGVWIQNGKLYVADTQDDRILIYNSLPASNGAAADVVLGQPDFTSLVQTNIADQQIVARANNLLNPVAVSSDGVRLYVTDLGFNRVLVWNTIPTSNQASADFALGQPDLSSSIPNYAYTTDSEGKNAARVLCDPVGTDSDGNPTYPDRCNATLSFPRYALSDGKSLFIADGGNDRVLVYNSIPTFSGESADAVLGQLGGQINQASDAADSMRTPMSMAWDGTNLFVSDAYNRRINVYSIAQPSIPYAGVKNAASLAVFAVGTVTLAGSVREKDTVTVTINAIDYKYTETADDTLLTVATQLAALINAGAGDPEVLATVNPVTGVLLLTAREAGAGGNDVIYSATTGPADTTIVATAAGANLSGGQDAAQVAPGTIVAVQGDNLSDVTASAPADAATLPTELGGVQVYFDGVRAPLVLVSPKEVRAQIPFEFGDTINCEADYITFTTNCRGSISAYVRTQHADGSVTVTAAVAATIVAQNPGIFADQGQDPRPGMVLHGSNAATGTISVDGSANAGDVATVNIEDRSYSYTVVDGDSLASIRDHLIDLINQDPKVEAYAAGSFTRIRLRARVEGPDSNGISIGASANDGGQVILTATNTALCCANVAYSRVTDSNPALPGETIIVWATGLGLPIVSDDNKDFIQTGNAYRGPITEPEAFVSSLAGGKTANVLQASLRTGMVGIYEVHLELNSDLPTDPQTQLTIAQDVYVSNIVTFPIVNPTPPETTTQ